MNWTGGRLSRADKKGSGALTARQKQHYAKVRANNQNVLHKWSLFNIQRQASSHPSAETQHARQPSHRSSQEPQSAQQYSRFQALLKIKRERSAPDKDYYDATPPPPKIRRAERGGPTIGNRGATGQDEETAFDRRHRLLLKGDWAGVTFQRPIEMKFAPPNQDEKVGRRRKVSDGHRARYSNKQSPITSSFTVRKHHQFSKLGYVESRAGSARSDVKIFIGGREDPPPISSSAALNARYTSRSSHIFDQHREASSDAMLLDSCERQSKDSTGSAYSRDTSANKPTGSSSSASRKYDSYNGWDTSLEENVADCHEEVEIRRVMKDKGSENQRSILLTTPSKTYENYNGWQSLEESSRYEPENKRQKRHEDCKYPEEKDIFETNSTEATSHAQNKVGHPLLEQKYSAYAPQIQDPHHMASAQVNDVPNDRSPIFSSSSVSLLHPKPRSSGTSQFLSRELHSESPGLADSTAAEIGKGKCIVPSSQVFDNAIWETWMFLSEDKTGAQDLDRERSHISVKQDIPINPGISTASDIFSAARRTYTEGYGNTTSELSYVNQSDVSGEFGLSESMIPMWSESSPSLAACRHRFTKLNSSIIRSGRVHGIAAWQEKEKTIQSDAPGLPVASEGQKEVSRATVRVSHGTIRNERAVTPKHLSARSTQIEDADNIWMKFVFGSSSGTTIDSPFAGQNVTQPVGLSPKFPLDCPLVAQYSDGSDSQPLTDRWMGTSHDGTRDSSSPARASNDTTRSAGHLCETHLVSDSMMNQPPGSGSRETFSSGKPKKKIVFTKPRPFGRHKSNFEVASEEEPFYIGCDLLPRRRARRS